MVISRHVQLVYQSRGDLYKSRDSKDGRFHVSTHLHYALLDEKYDARAMYDAGPAFNSHYLTMFYRLTPIILSSKYDKLYGKIERSHK